MTTYLLTPSTVAEAVAARATAPAARVLAGGTDLVPDVVRGQDPTGYISLRAIPGLTGVTAADTVIRMGALTTVAELKSSAVIAARAPVLQRAARSLGSRQVRNRATVGGNVCAGGHQRSLVPALLALDASVEIAGPSGTRSADLAGVLTTTGPGLAPDEILTAIAFDAVAGPQAYFKIGQRNAVCYATAAVALVIDEPGRQVRLALGGVNPVPVRAREAEAVAAAGIDWSTRTVPDDVARAFGAAAAAAAGPVPDHVATPEYRRHAVEVMARRALAHAFEEVR